MALPSSAVRRLPQRHWSWLLAGVLASRPSYCSALGLAHTDQDSLQPFAWPGDTAWLNASEQCDPEVVCVVGPEERWLISSNLTVDALHVKGIIKWDETVPDIVLTAGWIFIDEGGTFQVGSVRAPIGWHPGVMATIYIKKSAINRHETYGERFLNGCGGTVKMFGMPKLRTWDLLSRTAAMGSTELFLKHDPVEMGWRIGDEIGLATTSMGYSTRHRIVGIRQASDEQLVVASATTGAQEAHLPAANTIDGNVGSLWSSFLGDETEQWLTLDLAHPSNVTRVRFHFQEPRYAPNYSLEVLTSKDDNWIKAAQVDDGRAGWREVQMDQREVVAIRMVADYESLWNRGERGHEPAWSGLWLNEVQVYGRKVGETMPTVIVLDTPVQADHMGGTKHIGGHEFEMAAEVVNLERSILITGDHEDINETQEGFSTAMMDGGMMDIRYARVEYCGRRNMMGKYCLHLHKAGHCAECTFQGNAVVDSQQVGITIHDSHKALIDQNVLWDARAAGIYIEDGNEMDNIFSRNVVICSHHSECAVSWIGKGSDQSGGFYVIGMTNNFIENRVVGYSKCFYAAGSANTQGAGYAFGKVCPKHLPFGHFKGNVNHDCSHYGLYLDHQYPRNVVRDDKGHVTSGCGEFTDGGKDNGVTPANTIEDQFEWHNTFVGQYAMGDIAFVRFKSMNNGHSMYWKTSKNFADGVSHHMRECIFGNDPHDPIGRLQVYGPSGPFTFKFTDNIFVGGPVGSAALCAGQHCGLGGAGGPCNVQYLMQNVSWSGLMAWQKKLQFGVNAASFGFVQPILLTKDNYSLGGFSSMVSQHLNGFKALEGCEQQSWEWDNGIACHLPIRRLNFWSNTDQGNVTLSGPGYDDVEPNYADPVEGLNAGLLSYEPMHRGYGAPVVAGANYSVIGSWHGDVAVEFSDPEAAEYFGVDQDNLTLDVVNGTSCDLTSSDPRNYLSPLGTDGQAQGVQLEEVLSCMIQGKVIVHPREDDPEPVLGPPTGRLNGTCEFPSEPGMTYHWDPYCFFGGLGCFADGKNPECGFCGRPPFKNCTEAATTAPPTTEATTSTTSSTTPFVDRTIRNLQGMCLAASADVDVKGYVEMSACNNGNLSQQWVLDKDWGSIKNLLCLHTHNGSDVHLQPCWLGNAHQNFTYNEVNGHLISEGGLCLEAPGVDGEVGDVVMAACVEYAREQQWSVGDHEILPKEQPPPTTTTTATSTEEQPPPTTTTTNATSTEAAPTAAPTPMPTPGPTPVPTQVVATTTTTTTTTLRLSSQIRNEGLAGYCLDAEIDANGGKVQASVEACRAESSDENWTFVPSTWLHGKGIIRTEKNRCLDAPQNMDNGTMVHMWWCWGNLNQMWSYDAEKEQIKHLNNLCLTGPSNSSEGQRVVLAACDSQDDRQKWRIVSAEVGLVEAKHVRMVPSRP